MTEEDLFEKVLIESALSEDDEFFQLREIATSNSGYEKGFYPKPEHLLEMSKLNPKSTGLPVPIWIDEGRTFSKSGHGRRIKFQGSQDSNSRTWLTMTIEKNPRIIGKKEQIELSPRELKKIQRFIVSNLEYLNQLGENDFDIVDFVKLMKKVN